MFFFLIQNHTFVHVDFIPDANLVEIIYDYVPFCYGSKYNIYFIVATLYVAKYSSVAIASLNKIHTSTSLQWE